MASDVEGDWQEQDQRNQMDIDDDDSQVTRIDVTSKVCAALRGVDASTNTLFSPTLIYSRRSLLVL